MSNLIPLNYKGASVRQVEKDGATWFVATDVCGILEMKNPTKALSSLDSDEKHTLTITEGIAKDSRAQAIAIVNESGLYHLIFNSRKPEAKAFRRWVTGTVLPAIRKHGEYVAEGLKKENNLLRQRDEIFGNKVRPGTISKANGLPRILPRKGTMCAPKSKHTRINAAMYQLLLFDPLTFALMLKDTVVRPSHPAESAQGTQEVGR